MSRIANRGRAREYRSELREQQAEETRGRILDATGRVIARGVASLTVPAVAREAGVSVPTVYRHFRTKHDLLAAIYPHVMRRAGIREFVLPKSLDELRDRVRDIFAQVDTYDDLARAAMASPGADEVRALSMPRRLARMRELVDTFDPKPRPRDRDRIVRLLVILTSSSALRTWRDHLGLSVAEAADDLDWVIRAAAAAAGRKDR
jgi:AcrR family transcriptional regulator